MPRMSAIRIRVNARNVFYVNFGSVEVHEMRLLESLCISIELEVTSLTRLFVITLIGSCVISLDPTISRVTSKLTSKSLILKGFSIIICS